jgi:hypothetical protein
MPRLQSSRLVWGLYPPFQQRLACPPRYDWPWSNASLDQQTGPKTGLDEVIQKYELHLSLNFQVFRYLIERTALREVALKSKGNTLRQQSAYYPLWH